MLKKFQLRFLVVLGITAFCLLFGWSQPQPSLSLTSRNLPMIAPIQTSNPLYQTSELAVSESVLPIANNSRTIFDRVLPRLAATVVPLRLPKEIPLDYRHPPHSPLPLSATVSVAQPDGYSVYLGFVEDCQGGNYCRYASIGAKKITPSTKSIPEEHRYLNDPEFMRKQPHHSFEPMEKVTLVNGIQGYFVPWICGANCNDGKIIWDEGGYRYTIGIKAGSKKAVLQMANSVFSQGE